MVYFLSGQHLSHGMLSKITGYKCSILEYNILWICWYGYFEELQYVLNQMQMGEGVSLNLSIIFHFGKASGLNSFGLTWCNGMICGPITS